jgi:uncharacterized protein (UPF0332 family)
MAFNWELYIQLASELKNESDEAKLRSAVSRGYYGAYHKTKIKLGYTANQYAKHELVVDGLRNSEEIENNSALANQLDNLKQSRVKADYHAFERIDKPFVNSFWARLDRYLNLINKEE